MGVFLLLLIIVALSISLVSMQTTKKQRSSAILYPLLCGQIQEQKSKKNTSA